MNRYVFLDIDGPLIPTQCYFISRDASFSRIFSNVAVYTVKRFLNVTHSTLITNSSHNYHFNSDTNTDLKTDLVNAGIPEEKFHTNWRTGYPHNERLGPHNSPRLSAIQDWLAKNTKPDEVYDWVCFDDEPFTDLPNLIKIDFDKGITVESYQAALKHFKIKDKHIVLI